MKNTRSITLMSSIAAFTLLMVGCDNNTIVKESTDLVIPSRSTPALKVAGWYATTHASATASNDKVYTHSTAGIFGELLQSQDAKDKHDIKSYGSALIQVVFPQTEWDKDNGYYFSNYKSYVAEADAKRVWTFQLRHDVTKDATGTTVDLKNAPITIRLNGTYDVTYLEKDGSVEYKESTTVNTVKRNTLNLVDVDNANSYTLAELQTAKLNMDGKSVRTFRWVAGAVDADDYAPLPIAKISQGTLYKQVNDSTAEDISDKISKFGLPPH